MREPCHVTTLFWGVSWSLLAKQSFLRKAFHQTQLQFLTEVLATPLSPAIILGDRIRGTLGDIDPLNKVPFKRATSRVQKGPL